MAVDVRKWVVFAEEIHEEGGRALERPLRKAAAVAVVKNPYAGAWTEDVSILVDAGEWLATELVARAQAALGSPVESYGKGGIVGEAGELEHVAALIHPKFGAPVRTATNGVSILPSVKKRGAMGAHLDVPLHHRTAMLVRSHFDGMEICVPDAPASDEILIALAVADGGRPHARVGGLRAEDAVGEDGLR